MRTRIHAFILVIATAALLTACTTTGTGTGGWGLNKQTGGAVLGGIGGGALGSQIGGGTGKTAAIIGGTLLGGWLGSEVGASLDKADQMYAAQAQYNAVAFAPPNQTVAWQSQRAPNTGGYTVAGPVQQVPVQGGGSAYCREYQTTVVVGGQSQKAFGNACQGADGQWRIQN